MGYAYKRNIFSYQGSDTKFSFTTAQQVSSLIYRLLQAVVILIDHNLCSSQVHLQRCTGYIKDVFLFNAILNSKLHFKITKRKKLFLK